MENIKERIAALLDRIDTSRICIDRSSHKFSSHTVRYNNKETTTATNAFKFSNAEFEEGELTVQLCFGEGVNPHAVIFVSDRKRAYTRFAIPVEIKNIGAKLKELNDTVPWARVSNDAYEKKPAPPST